MSGPKHPDGEPWQWPEDTWRRITGRARAGRSLVDVAAAAGIVAGALGLLLALIGYTAHCVWVSAEMYSAPSIVLQTR